MHNKSIRCVRVSLRVCVCVQESRKACTVSVAAGDTIRVQLSVLSMCSSILLAVCDTSNN